MKRWLLLVMVCVLVIAANAAMATKITYTLFDIAQEAGDTDRWQFDWKVINDSLGVPLDDFVIYFDFGPGIDPYIKSLKIASDVAGWNEAVTEPSAIQLDGYFEAFADPGKAIAPGGSLGGFKCSFDWLGGGKPPASQLFEIYNTDFELADRGWTEPGGGKIVPEPTSMMGLISLLGLASSRWLRSRKK